jgi:uncharacterized protein HemX
MGDPISATGLAGAISSGVAIFLAIGGAFHQWLKLQRGETTQVTILSEDRDRWQVRAEEYRVQLNEINSTLSELKQQNAVLIVEMRHLREENEELRADIQKLSGGHNA